MRITLDDKVKNINTQQDLDEFIGLEVNENRPIDLNAYSRLISLRKGELSVGMTAVLWNRLIGYLQCYQYTENRNNE